MAFVNNHHKPEPVAVDSKVVLDPTIPYDLNCYYTGGELKNDRIKLVPFVVSRPPCVSTAYFSSRAAACHLCKAVLQTLPGCATGIPIPVLRPMADV